MSAPNKNNAMRLSSLPGMEDDHDLDEIRALAEQHFSPHDSLILPRVATNPVDLDTSAFIPGGSDGEEEDDGREKKHEEDETALPGATTAAKEEEEEETELGEAHDKVLPLVPASPAKGSIFSLRNDRRGNVSLDTRKGQKKSVHDLSDIVSAVAPIGGSDMSVAETLILLGGSPELLKANKSIHDWLDGQIRNLNLLNALLGTTCVVLTILLMELTFDDGKFDPDLSEAWPAQLIKGCQTFITITQQFLLYKLYQKFVQLDTAYIGHGPPPIHQSDRFGTYLAETALNIWHAPPIIHLMGIDPILLDKGSIVTLLRLYLWFRVYRDRHPLFRYRRWVIMSLIAQNPRKSIADLEIDTMLVFKHMYTRQPWQFFLSSVLGSIVFFAYGMYIAERVEQPDVFNDVEEILFFVLVTMTTVGYGNSVPVSMWGRVVAVSCAVVGITLMSLLLTTMVYFLEFSSSERRASNLTVKRKYNELVAGIDAGNPDLMFDEAERELRETENHLALFSTTATDSPTSGGGKTGSGSTTEDAKRAAAQAAELALSEQQEGAATTTKNDISSIHKINIDNREEEDESAPAPDELEDITLRAPGGICGLCLVPKPAREYADRIRALKRRRKYLNKERGQITISDQILQVGVEIQEMHHELSMHEMSIKQEARELAEQDEREQAMEEKKRQDALAAEGGGPSQQQQQASPVSANHSSSNNRRRSSTPMRGLPAQRTFSFSRKESISMTVRQRKKSLSAARLMSFSAKRKTVYDASVARKIVFGDEDGSVPINMDPELCALPDSTIHAFDNRIRNLNLIILSLSIVCIFLAVVFLELGWDSSDPLTPYKSMGATQPIKGIISFLTACSLYVIYLYYSTLVQFDAVMYKSKGRKTNLSIWNSDRLKAFLIESFVTLLHAPPFLDTISIGTETNGDPMPLMYDKVGCIVCFRIFFLMRVYRDYSYIYRWRKWLLSNADFRSNSPKITFDTVLSMKTLFSYSPWTFTAAGAFLSVFFFAYLIYAAERIEQLEFFSTAENCVYFICVTMTTVGYGDLSPVTVYGRFTAMVAATTGLCLSALLVTATMVSIGFTPNERKASQLVLARKTKVDIREAAARVMQTAWAHRKLLVQGHLPPTFKKLVSKRLHNPLCADEGDFMRARMTVSIRQLRRLVSYWFQFHGRDMQMNTEVQLNMLNESVVDLTSNIRDLRDQLGYIRARSQAAAARGWKGHNRANTS